MQNVVDNPLLLKEQTNGNTENKVECGSVFQQNFIVVNSGNKIAEINISIAPSDEKSESISQWCIIKPNLMRLEPGDSCPLELSLQIPQETTPHRYNYEIIIEAPQQYPDKFYRSSQQLLVSPVEQRREWGEAPSFQLQPSANSRKPHQLQAGEPLELTIEVENRSLLVDSYEISCPDLDSEWYFVRYPERDLELPGLILQSEGLKLNPGKKGKITLTLNPPPHTLAGNYVGTIRLRSQNRTELELLEALYFRILVSDKLENSAVQIVPPIREIPKDPGEFDLNITNQGNIYRNLVVSIRDRQKVFNYQLSDNNLGLNPGETGTIRIVSKTRWYMAWLRPWWGEGKEFNFDIDLENFKDTLLPGKSILPSLPTIPPQGAIIWLPRPLWQLILLSSVILAGVGTGVVALVWYLFWLPPLPRIETFAIGKNNPQEPGAKELLLNWEITNPKHLDKIKLIRTDTENNQVTKSYLGFDRCFGKKPKQCLPRNLAENLGDFCQVTQKTIICEAFPTETLPPSQYTYRLETYPRRVKKLFRQRNSREISDSITTDTIAILPAPTPQISRDVELATAKSSYEKANPEDISFKWEITQFDRLKRLNVLRKSSDGKVEAYPYIISETTNQLEPTNSNRRKDRLYCVALDSNTQQCTWRINDMFLPTGNYKFEIELFANNNSQEPSDTIALKNTISIEPEPLPVIQDFVAPHISYRQGEEPILLSWNILNPNQIQSIKINSISQTGSSRKIANYNFPEQIKQICPTFRENQKLLYCDNVKVGFLPVGNYTFELKIVPKQQTSEKIVQTSNTVEIKPKPFEITYFKINGQQIKSGSTYLYSHKSGVPSFLKLTWLVQGGNDLNVQLLPIGVKQPKNGSLNYSLPPNIERQTLTLKATNQIGETKFHSIILQPLESNSPGSQEYITKENEIDNIEPTSIDILEPIEILPKPN